MSIITKIQNYKFYNTEEYNNKINSFNKKTPTNDNLFKFIKLNQNKFIDIDLLITIKIKTV
jgi:hypothetical protein